jgi:hypothetical protein
MPAPTVVSTTTPQTGAASTMALNMPASVGATDMIWGWMSLSGVIGAMPGSPAFTLKLTGDSNQVWAYIRGADHIANGSPATYTFSTSGGVITRGMSSCISGVILTGDPTDGTPAVGTTTTSASSAALAITTTVVDTLLLNYDTKSSSSTHLTSPTGLTLQTPATSVAHLFAGPLAAAGGSGTKTSTYSTLTNHRSSLVALKPVTTQTVSPSGIAPTSDVGTPTLTPGVVTISPDGVAPTSDVGTPTLTPGAVTISPDGVAPTSDVGTPTLVPGVVTISPDGVAPTSDVGTPTVTQHLTISPVGVGPTSAVGTPTLTRQPFVTAVVYDHETGLPVGAGAVVQLFNADGTLIDTGLTGVDGSYLFQLPFGFTDQVFTVVRTTIDGTEYQGVSEVCPVST